MATDPDPFVVHTFPEAQDSHTYRESGSASGIGDIVGRAKYNFKHSGSWRFAGAFDLRLPTG